jgi:A/G-specific adenine glycosylase
MLQQTRVPTAIPYYERFLRTFPTVRKLARAPLERVLRLWAGLGYYQRARHLHAAAQQIVREHRGRFPHTLAAALALPGVGAYTARAVLSIAYGERVGVVDGNVARVLVRLFRLPARAAANRADLQPLADRVVSPARPGDFNQALMELGSTICRPRQPRCASCPLERLCAARQARIENRLPAPLRKRSPPRQKLDVLLVRRSGRLLLVREPRGVFSGLWHFPYGAAGQVGVLARRFAARGVRRLARVEHEMSARHLFLDVYAARAGAMSTNGLPQSWAAPSRVAQLGVGAATRKIAATVAAR